MALNPFNFKYTGIAYLWKTASPRKPTRRPLRLLWWRMTRTARAFHKTTAAKCRTDASDAYGMRARARSGKRALARRQDCWWRHASACSRRRRGPVWQHHFLGSQQRERRGPPWATRGWHAWLPISDHSPSQHQRTGHRRRRPLCRLRREWNIDAKRLSRVRRRSSFGVLFYYPPR